MSCDQPKLALVFVLLLEALLGCSGGKEESDGSSGGSPQKPQQQQQEQQVIQPPIQQPATIPNAPPTFEDALEIVAGSRDLEAPSPGNQGSIVATTIKAKSVSLSWAAATDNETQSSDLRSIVYYSTANNIDRVAKAELNGTAASSYKKTIKSLTVTGLSEGTKYYFNVIVKDEANNIAAYATKSITTGYVPVPGGNGALSAAQTSSDVVISWSLATHPANSPLSYTLYTSSSANIGTVEDLLTNGIAYSIPASGIDEIIIVDPGPSVRLFFNVLVSDADGNLAVYEQGSLDTAAEIFISYVDATNRDLMFVKHVDLTSSRPEIVESAGKV